MAKCLHQVNENEQWNEPICNQEGGFISGHQPHSAALRKSVSRPYSSRIEDPKYQFAGKTGTAQVKRISMRERELDLKIEQIPYKDRDHALYIAYGPYINPRYALSIIVEHGGSGSRTAAPIAKELFKLIIDRNDLRNKQKNFEELKI